MPVITASTISERRATGRLSRPRLRFKEITIVDMPLINRFISRAGSRTCDFSIGGLYMWIDYFNYSYCVYRDTLFIKGVVENHKSLTAFSMPVGSMPLAEAVEALGEYCAAKSLKLSFSAIPADRVDEFKSLGSWDVEEMTDWSDYLYDIRSLATLSGKKLGRKRNHVNRFMAENPEARLETLTAADVAEVEAAYDRWLDVSEDKDSDTAAEERRMTFSVLDNLESYPFEGAVLRGQGGEIAAFTLGEVIGDTVFVHIEKMNHAVAGAGETINKMFAERMLSLHPGLRYANREEDVGDLGLRQAKMSYNPVMMLSKYNLTAR